MAMHDCDLMIAVGSRFDDRVTGRLNAFAPNSKKIHIDIDPSSLNKNVRIDVPLLGDCGRVLTALTAAVKKEKKGDGAAKKSWWRQINEWRGRDCLRYDRSKKNVIKPQYALERLYELTKGRDTYITTEVGQHQMWAAQFFKFEEPYHWMTSGGLGTMGYGLPAAVGVQVAHPDALVIDIAGEASILMNIQEMSTIAQYKLPVKAFILNNQYMGMVRQWQELLHGARYSESYTAALPDFVKLADAFGGKGMRVEKPADLDDAIRAMLAHPGAFVLDVAVEEMENCFPMIPSGAAHNEMLLGPADKAKKAVSEEGMVLV
jgi:acetolactate synthase I/II/III large subunit